MSTHRLAELTDEARVKKIDSTAPRPKPLKAALKDHEEQAWPFGLRGVIADAMEATGQWKEIADVIGLDQADLHRRLRKGTLQIRHVEMLSQRFFLNLTYRMVAAYSDTAAIARSIFGDHFTASQAAMNEAHQKLDALMTLIEAMKRRQDEMDESMKSCA